MNFLIWSLNSWLGDESHEPIMSNWMEYFIN